MVRKPTPAEEYITIFDNKGRERVQHVDALGITQLMAVVVKWREGIKFFYNLHPQESSKVKGYREAVPPEVWYLASGSNLKKFGLKV